MIRSITSYAESVYCMVIHQFVEATVQIFSRFDANEPDRWLASNLLVSGARVDTFDSSSRLRLSGCEDGIGPDVSTA